MNVFLGIGIAWTIAAIYHAANNSKFVVPPGALGFSVTIFCILAFLACSILVIRRYTCIGELGGPVKKKYISSAIFFFFWIERTAIFCKEKKKYKWLVKADKKFHSI